MRWADQSPGPRPQRVIPHMAGGGPGSHYWVSVQHSTSVPVSMYRCTLSVTVQCLGSGLGKASAYCFGVRVEDLRKMICSPSNTALFICSHSECQEACCHYPLITTNKLSFNCHKFNQQQSHKSVCYGTPGTQVRDSWWEEGHDSMERGSVLTLFCIPHPWALIADIRQWGLVLDHQFMSQLPRVQWESLSGSITDKIR